jgi:hypothetical protein
MVVQAQVSPRETMDQCCLFHPPPIMHSSLSSVLVVAAAGTGRAGVAGRGRTLGSERTAATTSLDGTASREAVVAMRLAG